MKVEQLRGAVQKENISANIWLLRKMFLDLQVLTYTPTKISGNFFSYSFVSEHFFKNIFPTKTYIFLADKGFDPLLADMFAKNLSFSGRLR